jgi:hypothetical protein
MTSEPTTSPPLGLPGVVRCTLAVVGTFFFATGFDLYGYEQYGTPNPTYLNLAMAAVLAALVLADLRRPPPFAHSLLGLWILGWLVITGVWAVLVGSVPGMNDLTERYKAIFLLITMVVAFEDPRARKAGGYALAAVVVIMTLCNLADLFGIVQFQKGLLEVYAKQRVEGRASGFIYNSNEAGRSIVFATAVAFYWVPKSWRLPLLLVCAVGLVSTFSRGSMVMYAIFVLWVLWRREVGGWPTVVAAAVVAVLAALWLGGHAQRILSSVGAWNEDVALRIHISEWASDDSGRGALLAGAWEEFLRSPFLGHPFGDAEILAPHNMFIAFAIDHGLIGLFILPLLAPVIVLSDRRMAPFAALLLVAGLFSHVLLMEHAAIVAIALAAAGPLHREPRGVPAPSWPLQAVGSGP